MPPVAALHTPSAAFDPVDVHVGSRVRLRRTLLGMSQGKLGEAIGLTFQQIQKYERGANRISASTLYRLSQVLDVPVSFFFDGMPPSAASTSDASSSVPHRPANDAHAGPDLMARRETVDLARNYYRINDHNIRRRLFDLIKGMADVSDTSMRAPGKVP